MNNFDDEYLRICRKVLDIGTWQFNNRTNINCLMYHGDMMQFDLSSGKFPLLTTKQIYTKQMIAELLGFIRAFDNAKKFREVGCNFWNVNANESVDWLNNMNRKGEDDLGRIYGVQARNWGNQIDQLGDAINKLSQGIDDRRLIVCHWNPGELALMSLPPCHLLYQFGLRGEYIDLSLYQRSCDVALGIPINIASYSLLLYLVARIVNLKPGLFTHFMHNIHIYENQLDGIREQSQRIPYESPRLLVHENIKKLEDLETWVMPKHITFVDYKHHPAIAFPFAA